MPENGRQPSEPFLGPMTEPNLTIQSNEDERPGGNAEEIVPVVTPSLLSAISNRHNYARPTSDVPDKLTWECISTTAKWIILKTVADYNGKPTKNFGDRKRRNLVDILRLTLRLTPIQVHDFMAIYMVELEALFEYEQTQKEISWESLKRQAAATNGALLDWLPAKRPDLAMDFVTQKHVHEASVFLWQSNLNDITKDLDRWRGIRADGEFVEIEIDLDTVQNTFDSIMLQQAVKVGLIKQTTGKKLLKSLRYKDIRNPRHRGDSTGNGASAQGIFNRGFTGDSEPLGAIKMRTNSPTTLATNEANSFYSKTNQEHFEEAFSTHVEKLSSSFPQPGEEDRIRGAYVPFPNATAISPFTTLEHVPSLENFAIPDYRQDHDNYRLQVCRQIRAEQARITPVNFVPGYTVATNVEKNMDSLQAAMPVDLTSANTIAGKARQNPAEIQTTGASMASGARQLSHRPGGAQDTSLPTPLVRPRYQNLHQNIAQFTGSATDEILQAVRGRPALRLPGNTMKTSQVPTARPGIAGGHGTELTQINPPVTSVGSCDSKHAKTTQPGHAAPIANVNNDSLQDSDFHPSEIHRPFSSAADPLHQMHPQANHQGAFTGQGEITNSSSAPKATQYQAPEPPVPASVRLRQHLDSHHASRMKSAEPSEPEIIPCTTTKRKRQPSRRLIDNVLANSDATPVPRSDQDGDYDPSRSTRAAPKRNRLTPKRIARGSLENKKRTSARGQSDGAGDSPSFDSEKIKTSDGRVVGRARDQRPKTTNSSDSKQTSGELSERVPQTTSATDPTVLERNSSFISTTSQPQSRDQTSLVGASARNTQPLFGGHRGQVMESPNEPSVDRADFAWSANHAGFSIVSTRAKYALRAKRLMSTLNGDIPGAPAQSDLVSSDDLENRIQKMRESYDKAEAVSVSKVGQIANVANRAGCSDTAWYAVDAKEAQFAVHVTGLKGSDYDSPSTGASS